MECSSSSVLTFEEVVLQAALLHVLVDEQPVLVLAAVAHQLHQVEVPQLSQEDHLRLRPRQQKKQAEIASETHNPCATPTRSGPRPRAAVRTRSGHPTYPPGGCSRSPEPSRSLNHHRYFVPLAPSALLGVSFRRTRPRLVARRDIPDANRAVTTRPISIYLQLFY